MPSSTKMMAVTVVEDGEIFTYYMCEECEYWVMEHYDTFADGFSEGDVKLDRQECARG